MDKQEQILTILQEECAEVIQAISKVRRFGMVENKEQLEQEVADMLLMVKLLYDSNIIEFNELRMITRMNIKRDKLKHYSNIYD